MSLLLKLATELKKNNQILLTPKRFTSSVYLVVDGYIYM